MEGWVGCISSSAKEFKGFHVRCRSGLQGEQLWEQDLVSRLLANDSLPARITGLLALIETPKAMDGYLLRAQGQDDAKRRAHRCISAVQEALLLIDDQRMLG